MEKNFVIGHYTLEDENGNWDEYYSPLYTDESPELWGKEIEENGGFQIDYIYVDEETWNKYRDWGYLSEAHIDLIILKERKLVDNDLLLKLKKEISEKIENVIESIGLPLNDWWRGWIHPVSR